MRINKPQLFNGQYLASNDAILTKLFGTSGFVANQPVFSPVSGAKFLSDLIPWSDIPAADITDKIYGSTIKISDAAEAKTIKTYIDDAVANVRTYSVTGDDYISATSGEADGNVAFTLTTDTVAIAEAISGSVIDAADISITKDTTSDLIYTLNVNGKAAGTINIPEDQFLESGVYDSVKRALVLTFKVDKDGDKAIDTVEIPVSGLIKEFTAINGIALNDTVFSGVVAPASEGFLTVGADGFKLAGVQTAIDTASGAVIDYVNPHFNFLSGAVKYVSGAVESVSGDVQFVSGVVDFVSGKVSAEIERAIRVDGELDSKITGEIARATAAEEFISGKVSALADYKVYDGSLSGDAWVQDAENDLVKAGTVKTYVDDKVTEVVTGNMTEALTQYVKTERVVSEVTATSAIPTNTAVINYVTDYVAKNNGVYEWDFTSTEKPAAALTGLYVDAQGQTKFWDGVEFVATSEEVVDTIADETAADAVPSVSAVKTFVAEQVQSTVDTVNEKAVEMIEAEVGFGTKAGAEGAIEQVSGVVPGRVIAVYFSDGEQCYPSISYNKESGESVIYADAPTSAYTVVYAKRIGQANGALPAYEAAEPTEPTEPTE